MTRWLLLLPAFALTGCALHSSLPEMGSVPAFTLTDQDGRTFSSAALQGKVWVADFIFTNCTGPCPRLTAQMRHLQNILLHRGGASDRVRLVSITVDPGHDTPQALQEYARRFRADTRRWSFLTGSAAGIRQLTVDTFHVNTAADPLEHSTRFVLVDGRGRIRGYYESTDATVLERLADDIGSLSKEVF